MISEAAAIFLRLPNVTEMQLPMELDFLDTVVGE